MSNVDTNSSRFNQPAKWEQVKNFLEKEVAQGKYGLGDLLPSENQLCSILGVTRNTVRQALDELEKQGFVFKIRGKGTFLSNVDTQNQYTKVGVYALIVPDLKRSLIPSLTQGFDDRLYKQASQTLVCQSYNDVNRQANVILQLIYRGIDGVAINPVNSVDTPLFQIQMLLDNNIPVVTCHRPINGLDVPNVGWDWRKVGRLAVRHLIERGHKKFIYFGVKKYIVTEYHVKGIRDVLSETEFQLPEENIIWEPDSVDSPNESGKLQRLAKLLLSEQAPTAVICNDDNEAEMVHWFLTTKLKMDVPRDVSLIGFGNSFRDTVFREYLTSVVMDEYQLGSEAAELLCDLKIGKYPLNYNCTRLIELQVSNGSSIQSL